MNRQFENGDAVFFQCENPATGFIKRLAKDKSWADVRWNVDLDCGYVTRVMTENILLLCPVLNKHLKSKGIE